MTEHVEGALVTPTSSGGIRFLPRARVTFAGGRILAVEARRDRAPIERLLVPGFFDAHIHLPQLRVRGRFADALLPWLRTHIWPEEERFAEPAYRAEVARELGGTLVAAGTLGALVFGSPHGASAEDVLERTGPLRTWGGDTVMDRNSPDALLRETGGALAEADAHALRWGRRYAVTPRFAPTCTTALLRGLARIATARGCLVHTHLAENVDEVAWVASLHPEARSYLDVYDRAELLGPRTFLAHAIHLDDGDLRRLAESESTVVHCPTSNEALGSGRMPWERLRAAGVRVALGTDVGAGPDVSMLDVMAAFLRLQAGRRDVTPTEALRLSTRPARELLEGGAAGCLEEDAPADLVALRVLVSDDAADEALARALVRPTAGWGGRVERVVLGGVGVA